MDASVIVCTYNRADLLRGTVAALASQIVPDGIAWEVVVVDNNSRDATRAVVEEAQRGFPRLRYVFEGQQGLSNARNRGVAEARGRFLLFTDDDVRPEPEWLVTVVGAMEREGCEACGGYIAPAWEVAPPAWLTATFHGFLAINMDTSGPRWLGAGEQLPFGANMAFRREVFDRVGRFNPDLGRKGSQLIGSEETDLFRRVQAAGGRVLYLPGARVHHRIEAWRTRKAYFRRWRYQDSRNIGLVDGVPGERRLWGIPPYLFGQLASAVGRSLLGYLRLPADAAFRQEMIVWHFLGLMAGLRRRVRESGPGAAREAA